jgi:hypothetical protein
VAAIKQSVVRMRLWPIEREARFDVPPRAREIPAEKKRRRPPGVMRLQRHLLARVLLR